MVIYAKPISLIVCTSIHISLYIELCTSICFLLVQPSLGETDMSVYQEEWREVFLLSAEVYMFGALIYIILGRGERQWWAADTSADTDGDLTRSTTVAIAQEEKPRFFDTSHSVQ